MHVVAEGHVRVSAVPQPWKRTSESLEMDRATAGCKLPILGAENTVPELGRSRMC